MVWTLQVSVFFFHSWSLFNSTFSFSNRKLAPVFDEVGEKLKDENVVLVKVDATANDVPPLFEVRGFPTLFWLPKGSKASPVKYEGGREADDFLKYIAKHATNELKGFDRSGKAKEAKTEL